MKFFEFNCVLQSPYSSVLVVTLEDYKINTFKKPNDHLLEIQHSQWMTPLNACFYLCFFLCKRLFGYDMTSMVAPWKQTQQEWVMLQIS